ncbi:MAG TPA: hypothetical protein VIH57_04040, partial [Bacteroidales bacterium]
PVPVAQYDGLANRWFQPLTHLSRLLSNRTYIWGNPVRTSPFVSIINVGSKKARQKYKNDCD